MHTDMCTQAQHSSVKAHPFFFSHSLHFPQLQPAASTQPGWLVIVTLPHIGASPGAPPSAHGPATAPRTPGQHAWPHRAGSDTVAGSGPRGRPRRRCAGGRRRTAGPQAHPADERLGVRLPERRRIQRFSSVFAGAGPRPEFQAAWAGPSLGLQPGDSTPCCPQHADDPTKLL